MDTGSARFWNSVLGRRIVGHHNGAGAASARDVLGCAANAEQNAAPLPPRNGGSWSGYHHPCWSDSDFYEPLLFSSCQVLHIKLGFVVALIVLHGLVAMRSKAVSIGRVDPQRSEAPLLFWTVLAVFLLILIATLPGEVFLTT